VTRKPLCCHIGQAQSHFHGVTPRNNYMHLQRLTIDASHASYSTPN
jgi:hypothetical protein